MGGPAAKRFARRVAWAFSSFFRRLARACGLPEAHTQQRDLRPGGFVFPRRRRAGPTQHQVKCVAIQPARCALRQRTHARVLGRRAAAIVVRSAPTAGRWRSTRTAACTECCRMRALEVMASFFRCWCARHAQATRARPGKREGTSDQEDARLYGGGRDVRAVPPMLRRRREGSGDRTCTRRESHPCRRRQNIAAATGDRSL